MAGSAARNAEIALATVDRGHDAKRESFFIQDGSLLNVYLDEPKIPGWITLNRRDLLGLQPRLQHGILHEDTIGVGLGQPVCLKLPGQCTRSQKSRLVTLAFFFAKGHDLDAIWHATALQVQVPDAGQGNINPQATIIFSTVSDGVIVTACHEHGVIGFEANVAPHHVTNCIDEHFIASARLHVFDNLLGASLMGFGQIGDSELPLFGKTFIGVLGEILLPVPNELTLIDVLAKLIMQMQFGDSLHLTKCFFVLEVRTQVQVPFEDADCYLKRMLVAAGITRGEQKTPTKLILVVIDQLAVLSGEIRLRVFESGRRETFCLKGGDSICECIGWYEQASLCQTMLECCKSCIRTA